MAKTKIKYECTECGYIAPKWMGKCMECGSFNSFEEITTTTKNKTIVKNSKVYPLVDVETSESERVKTNYNELDRVLSGGFVVGSLTLFGGNPGIGKSTMLLQICQNIGEQDKKILYISGEESASQIKLRANRLKITSENIYINTETNITNLVALVDDVKPEFLIVDSIQTVYDESLTSSMGSITQTRECVAKLMNIAKTKDITIIIVSHVTKEGAIAGPKLLEHMVDTVIYFEGEKYANYRILRTIKNRFGSTNEIGVFEMEESGLVEIENPSEYMLSGRPINAPGSMVTCVVEGSRPILTEVQALVSYTTFGQPRRTANGIDYNRVVMLIAVLEKRCNLQLSNFDAYINIAGGLRITEPSIDLAIIATIISSYKNLYINSKTIAFGEVGLTGEVRGVSNIDKKVAEAEKMGFDVCILPKSNINDYKSKGIKLIGINNISELLKIIV